MIFRTGATIQHLKGLSGLPHSYVGFLDLKNGQRQNSFLVVINRTGASGDV